MVYHLFSYPYTVCWQEDLGKFPNCLNSIPNENLGLKKENEQNFFCKYVWRKKLYYWVKIAGRGLNS